MEFADVTLLAVLVAAAASYAIGSLWYSPLLFGKVWMKYVGRSEEQLKAGMKMAMVGGAVASIVMAFGVAVITGMTGAATIAEGITLGFWLWLGFVLAVSLMNVFYEGQKKQVFLIFNGYQLLALLVMGAIIAGWPR
ncbi:MAG: DUF1761 domain-containing protein [Candidatus Spechtbacterales bacterium]